ncbi:MAG TPA: hypothetical protein VIG80_01670 [Bacillaceae bacterium]
MKLALSIIGCLVIAITGYLLYQSQLGAIPFLFMSFVLFYLAYLLRPKQDDQTNELPEDDLSLEKAEEMDMDLEKKV